MGCGTVVVSALLAVYGIKDAVVLLESGANGGLDVAHLLSGLGGAILIDVDPTVGHFLYHGRESELLFQLGLIGLQRVAEVQAACRNVVSLEEVVVV